MSLDFNMSASEVMASYCVIVNDGSGVLVNAMTQAYSYVLTARHAIKLNAADNVVIDNTGKRMQVLEVLLYPDAKRNFAYDCGILKVAFDARIVQRASLTSDLPHRAFLTLVGFPATERASAHPIKHYDGHMTSDVDDFIIFTIDTIPGLATIKGMSGGGVYHVVGNEPRLVAVEFRMDGTSEDQQYGRVQCYGLIRFQEIITAHDSAPMVPPYLECFSRLRGNIFGFNVIDPHNVARLKAELLTFADSLVACGIPAPYELMGKYQSDLLLDSQCPSEVQDLELWVAYFEFLIICAVLDNSGVVDAEYIQGLERRRRLLYTSDSSNWIGRLETVLKTARKLLDKGGIVIVASPELGADILPPGFLIDRVVSNIAVVPRMGPLAPIDQADSSLYKSFVLAHLEGIRKRCVVDGEWEFSKIAPGFDQLRLLKEKLDEIIK